MTTFNSNLKTFLGGNGSLRRLLYDYLLSGGGRPKTVSINAGSWNSGDGSGEILSVSVESNQYVEASFASSVTAQTMTVKAGDRTVFSGPPEDLGESGNSAGFASASQNVITTGLGEGLTIEVDAPLANNVYYSYKVMQV